MANRTVYRRGLPVLAGLRYRGREGMFAWLLHRVSGLGVLLFLVLHIFDIFLMGLGPEIFNSLLVLYHSWWGRIMTCFLVFGLLFHAVNGARIIIQDFWPRLWRHQAKLIWIETAIFIPVFLWTAFVTLRPLFGYHP
jgi:succinate dehydrogenase / fumarate reductase cytochrome b subunit